MPRSRLVSSPSSASSLARRFHSFLASSPRQAGQGGTLDAGRGSASFRRRLPGLPRRRTTLLGFISKKAEIDVMLTRLQALSDDHFGYAPDEITWSHVGTLEHYAELLKRITDMAFNEGEHAAYPAADLPPAPRAAQAAGASG